VAERVNRHGQQRDRDLLAGREQHVDLALGRRGRDLVGEPEQSRPCLAHGGHHDDDAVAGLGCLDDAPGDAADLLGVGDRGSAVLLDDQSHGRLIARAMLPHGPHAFKRGATTTPARASAPPRSAMRCRM
jgi:hypothetical protein